MVSVSNLVRKTGDDEDGRLGDILLHRGLHHHRLVLNVQHTLIVHTVVLNGTAHSVMVMMTELCSSG